MIKNQFKVDGFMEATDIHIPTYNVAITQHRKVLKIKTRYP